jgi:hypothetical protein
VQHLLGWEAPKADQVVQGCGGRDAEGIASRRMFNAKERGRNRSSGGTSQKMGPLTSEAASGPGAARVREVILMGLNLSSSEYDRGHPRSVRSVRSQQREHIPSPACGCR